MATDGSGYGLISNAEWQTIARNIEQVSSNWSSGTVGTGALNYGHSDGSPNNAIAASSDDADPCFETGQSCSSTTWDRQRRTFTLSNGEVIWDFAGNVWQWTADANSTVFGADAYMYAVTTATHTATGTIGSVTGNAKTVFGPHGDYTSLSSTPSGGLGRGYLNASAGGIARGGAIFQRYRRRSLCGHPFKSRHVHRRPLRIPLRLPPLIESRQDSAGYHRASCRPPILSERVRLDQKARAKSNDFKVEVVRGVFKEEALGLLSSYVAKTGYRAHLLDSLNLAEENAKRSVREKKRYYKVVEKCPKTAAFRQRLLTLI